MKQKVEKHEIKIKKKNKQQQQVARKMASENMFFFIVSSFSRASYMQYAYLHDCIWLEVENEEQNECRCPIG